MEHNVPNLHEIRDVAYKEKRGSELEAGTYINAYVFV